jgi:hypothetical protein
VCIIVFSSSQIAIKIGWIKFSVAIPLLQAKIKELILALNNRFKTIDRFKN